MKPQLAWDSLCRLGQSQIYKDLPASVYQVHHHTSCMFSFVSQPRRALNLPCSQGGPGTPEPNVSTSQVLGSQVCAMPSFSSFPLNHEILGLTAAVHFAT